ncbi:MAG: alpha/beta hydrolase, partial [Betaproteobacteria bacterium]|nr:alpha/beta hydrolase [Betaproteobacteria bacterium]
MICPPIGYELWSSYATLRAVAQDACAAGFTVLRFDYDGTGDSVGDHRDADRLQAWVQSIDQACRHLVDELGVRKLSLLGLRLGASLAATYAARMRPEWLDELILWDPVVNGRRHVRGLMLVATPDPSTSAVPEPLGAGSPDAPRAEGEPGSANAANDGRVRFTGVAGTVHSAETLDAVAALNLITLDAPDCKVLLLHRPDRDDCATLAQTWASAGVRVDSCADDGIEKVIDRATEEAELPASMLHFLRGRFAESAAESLAMHPAAARLAPMPPRDTTTFRHAPTGTELVERFVRIGPD